MCGSAHQVREEGAEFCVVGVRAPRNNGGCQKALPSYGALRLAFHFATVEDAAEKWPQAWQLAEGKRVSLFPTYVSRIVARAVDTNRN